MPSKGIPARGFARHALKPPVRSCGRSPSTIRANTDPPREISRRPTPQSRTAPPSVEREPMTRSASPRSTGSISDGRIPGSCDQSASIWTTTAAPEARATVKPSRYARPRPAFAGRWRTRTRGSRAARTSARSPVPSGDESSTTSSVAPGSVSRIAVAMPSRFSASSYVGRTTHVPVPTAALALGGPPAGRATDGGETAPAPAPPTPSAPAVIPPRSLRAVQRPGGRVTTTRVIRRDPVDRSQDDRQRHRRHVRVSADVPGGDPDRAGACRTHRDDERDRVRAVGKKAARPGHRRATGLRERDGGPGGERLNRPEPDRERLSDPSARGRRDEGEGIRRHPAPDRRRPERAACDELSEISAGPDIGPGGRGAVPGPCLTAGPERARRPHRPHEATLVVQDPKRRGRRARQREAHGRCRGDAVAVLRIERPGPDELADGAVDHDRHVTDGVVARGVVEIQVDAVVPVRDDEPRTIPAVPRSAAGSAADRPRRHERGAMEHAERPGGAFGRSPPEQGDVLPSIAVR